VTRRLQETTKDLIDPRAGTREAVLSPQRDEGEVMITKREPLTGAVAFSCRTQQALDDHAVEEWRINTLISSLLPPSTSCLSSLQVRPNWSQRTTKVVAVVQQASLPGQSLGGEKGGKGTWEESHLVCSQTQGVSISNPSTGIGTEVLPDGLARS
jgi:hypothetical protein